MRTICYVKQIIQNNENVLKKKVKDKELNLDVSLYFYDITSRMLISNKAIRKILMINIRIVFSVSILMLISYPLTRKRYVDISFNYQFTRI